MNRLFLLLDHRVPLADLALHIQGVPQGDVADLVISLVSQELRPLQRLSGSPTPPPLFARPSRRPSLMRFATSPGRRRRRRTTTSPCTGQFCVSLLTPSFLPVRVFADNLFLQVLFEYWHTRVSCVYACAAWRRSRKEPCKNRAKLRRRRSGQKSPNDRS